MKKDPMQLDLFEIQEVQERQDKRFRRMTEKYQKWLTLPDRTRIKEGTLERKLLSGILWSNYCELYSSAEHRCESMPDDMYIWMNPCHNEYWVINKRGNIQGEKADVCPYCGAELHKGKGDAYLYKAEAKHWLFYLHYDVPMKKYGYQPKEDREAIRNRWG